MTRWLLLSIALFAAPALGERTDRDKPLNYEADTGECDDLQQVCVLAGNVVLVKGTIRATGDRVQISKDPESSADPPPRASWRPSARSAIPASRGSKSTSTVSQNGSNTTRRPIR